MPSKEEYRRDKEYYREYMKKYRKMRRANNPDKRADEARYMNEYMKDYLKDPINRKKYLARQTLNNRIREGVIERGVCEVSKCKLTGHAHHDNYDKPLEVRWLCRRHHEDLHHNLIKLT